MTQNQLVDFKKEVRKFHAVIEPIAELYGFDHLITLSVLVQNLGADATGTSGYSIQGAAIKVDQLRSVIKKIKNYKNSHIENWIHNEIEMIHTSIVMAETYKTI